MQRAAYPSDGTYTHRRTGTRDTESRVLSQLEPFFPRDGVEGAGEDWLDAHSLAQDRQSWSPRQDSAGAARPRALHYSSDINLIWLKCSCHLAEREDLENDMAPKLGHKAAPPREAGAHQCFCKDGL